MPIRISSDARTSRYRFSLGGVMIGIAVLAVLLLIVSRPARHHDWGIVFFLLGVFSILAISVLMLGLVIRQTSSSRANDQALFLVVGTLLLIILLCLTPLTNRL
jgi:hypothetical protein